MDRLHQQHRDRRDLDEGQEVARRLFVARRNTAKLFDAVDESLHQVPLFVQMAIKFPLVLQVAARRNHRFGTAALDVFEKEPLPADSPLLDPEIADRCRLFHHFASGAQITRLDIDPDKGMAGRCVQGLIDVLEGNYGGDPTKMPYVVNKEAFAQSR